MMLSGGAGLPSWDGETRVYVGRLPDNVDRNELESIFAQYGPIKYDTPPSSIHSAYKDGGGYPLLLLFFPVFFGSFFLCLLVSSPLRSPFAFVLSPPPRRSFSFAFPVVPPPLPSLQRFHSPPLALALLSSCDVGSGPLVRGTLPSWSTSATTPRPWPCSTAATSSSAPRSTTSDSVPSSSLLSPFYLYSTVV
jgi:RNA recognition motif-containing protein